MDRAAIGSPPQRDMSGKCSNELANVHDMELTGFHSPTKACSATFGFKGGKAPTICLIN